MKKRMLCLLLGMLMLLLPLCAAGEGKVFSPEETEPFAADAVLLTVRVCPALGGDCMLMTLGDHSMFVDLGSEAFLPMINTVIEAAGIDRAEYVFNTHPHQDHIGGFKPLLEQGFPVGTLITFFPHKYQGGTTLQLKAIHAAEIRNIPILDLHTEDIIEFGDARLTVLRVPDDRIRPDMNVNDLSAMLMVRYGSCSILLSADVEERAQKVLAELYDLKADILKFPHHGVEAALPEFLDEAAPEYVVFTHGAQNTEKAQRQLLQKGICRMAFASWGMITLQTDGEKWIVWQDLLPDKESYAQRYLSENSWIRP